MMEIESENKIILRNIGKKIKQVKALQLELSSMILGGGGYKYSYDDNSELVANFISDYIAGSTDGRLADSMQIDIEEVVRLRNMFGLVKNLMESITPA